MIKLSKADRRKLSMLSLCSQDYPFKGSNSISSSFRETLGLNKDVLAGTLPKRVKNYFPSKFDGDIIKKALIFEEKEVPPPWHAQNYIAINDGNLDIFGNKVPYPRCLVLDFGPVFCQKCYEQHLKSIVFYKDQTLYIDYLASENVLLCFDKLIPDFWLKANHTEDMTAPRHALNKNRVGDEELYEFKGGPFDQFENGECWPYEVERNDISFDDWGWLKFIGRSWSYNTRISKNDTIHMKLKRVPKELRILRNRVKTFVKSIDRRKYWSIDAIHYSNGWTVQLPLGEEHAIPPFIILYCGAYKCHRMCQEVHRKYVLFTNESPTHFCEYKENSGDVASIDEHCFFRGIKIDSHPGCH